MWKNFFGGLSLVDRSGYAVIALIVLVAVIATVVNLSIRRYYGALEHDIRRARGGAGLQHGFLKRIVSEAGALLAAPNGDGGIQALLEHRFNRDLKGSLTAERFIKSAPGLTIVLGLIGTFYGLTLSIGKLVTLIAGDVSGAAEITKTLTTGLTGALSGMSVAFSTSLFGIVASVILVLLNVFSSLPDKRTSLLLSLEVYLDKVRQEQLAAGAANEATVPLGGIDGRTAAAIDTLGASVAKLQASIDGFDAALVGFAENTRDFQEFNLHLKDNIQRMSLGFADLSDTLKTYVRPTPSGPSR